MSEETRPLSRSDKKLAKKVDRDEAARLETEAKIEKDRLEALETELTWLKFQKGHAKSQQEEKDLPGQ